MSLEDLDVQHDGAELLDDVLAFLRRFLALPNDAAYVAVTLWAAHAHTIDSFESTPRIAFLSPEPASGKTRALEVLDLLVPNPMHAVNCTPAALFRAVAADQAVTVLFDEIDAVFGPKAKENEELRSLLNAGHRRSGVAYRCVGEGSKQRVVEFPAYAPVALAGLGDLPDTLLSRSIVVRMRRRAPDEIVEPFRMRFAAPPGHGLRDRLAGWTAAAAGELAAAVPDMPDGVTDRPADVWEPLLATADAAGGPWPQRARNACVAFVADSRQGTASLGIRLLADLRTVFADADSDRLSTADILDRLCKLDEAPWGELRGRPLSTRGLAKMLDPYGIKSASVRTPAGVLRGYRVEDLHDAWTRYLPSFGPESATSATAATPQVSGLESVADNAQLSATCYTSATGHEPLTSGVAHVADVADLQRQEQNDGKCEVCGQRMIRLSPDQTTHPACGGWSP